MALLLACSGVYSAQDTLQLLTVDVVVPRQTLSRMGKKTGEIDSLRKAQFAFNSVATLLSYDAPVHIKSYGPGGLASTAFRGGSAEHTAILWNGFNIQNTMLGQTDLTLLPSMLFETVSTEYGGSSALWGSGAVAGGLHLNSDLPFRNELSVTAGAGAGSFGERNVLGDIRVSGAKIASSTKISWSSSLNDFPYRGRGALEGQELRQRHASYDFRNFMQSLRFLVNARQWFTANLWMSDNNRQLPAFIQMQESRAYQDDAAVRATGSWHYAGSRLNTSVRGAMFDDRVAYTDSALGVYAKSITRTLLIESENYFRWHRQHRAGIAVNALHTSARSTNYLSERGLSRISLVLSNRSRFWNDRLLLGATLRAEHFSAGELPVTGTLAGDIRLLEGVTMGLNAATVYRQPTLNELYWAPGGNPGLRPEKGTALDANLSFSRMLDRVGVKAGASCFSRNISDWILWVPGTAGNPTPLNVQEVWSRGIETDARVSYTKRAWRMEAGAKTSYVLSTIAASNQMNSGSVGRQLVYTPRYTATGSFLLSYRSSVLTVFTQYTGYRFSASDNSEWLDPYLVTSLRFSQLLRHRRFRLQLFAACNNLFNADYLVVPGRPMPLRGYEAGITMNLVSQFKNHTN